MSSAYQLGPARPNPAGDWALLVAAAPKPQDLLNLRLGRGQSARSERILMGEPTLPDGAGSSVLTVS